MTEYKKSSDGTVVRDFAKRTLDNLRYIEEQYRRFRASEQPTEVFEVTQLINSMLGLLVFPKEAFWDHLKSLPLTEIPQGVNPFHTHRKAPNLRQLIRRIRNSFSHFNLEIKANDGYICAIQMHNEWEGEIVWEDIVSVFELRRFVEWFIEGIIDSSLLDMRIETIKAA